MTPVPNEDRQDQSVASQYNAWARVYDVLWHRYMQNTLPVLQRAAAVETGDRVLDLACGTGELVRRMAKETPGAELTGVDLSPKMVERARHKCSSEPGIRIEQADAHNLPFTDDTYDVVTCASTFHYFTRPSRVLDQVKRILRPGGRLVLLDWCRDYWTCRVMDIWLQYVDPAHGTCYTLADLTTLLNRAAMDVTDAFRYRFDLVWGIMVVTAVPFTD